LVIGRRVCEATYPQSKIAIHTKIAPKPLQTSLYPSVCYHKNVPINYYSALSKTWGLVFRKFDLGLNFIGGSFDIFVYWLVVMIIRNMVMNVIIPILNRCMDRLIFFERVAAFFLLFLMSIAIFEDNCSNITLLGSL